MKKSLVGVLALFGIILLVGCGSKSAPNAPTNQGTPTVNTATNNQEGDTQEVVAENNGAVEVDTAYTTALANCMTENGITMYGTERCSHCQNQKALFGDAFANVDYVDCDADRQACLDAGVRGFPTWIDAESNPYPGTQTLERLAAISGCEDI